MNILVIDNGTKYLPQLISLLTKHQVSVINFSEIQSSSVDNYDVIILSGGHKFPINGNESKLEKEIELIKSTSVPIFGICFGFELIAHCYGAELELMNRKEKGILDINVIVPDVIFDQIPNFKVYESHRWVVKKTSTELIALAESKDGIEAIKHKTKPIYAVQFHPEMVVDKTCGDEIFFNFLNRLTSV
jgi:anthranilate/para-aminobenzoate synthase component II